MEARRRMEIVLGLTCYISPVQADAMTGQEVGLRVAREGRE